MRLLIFTQLVSDTARHLFGDNINDKYMKKNGIFMVNEE